MDYVMCNDDMSNTHRVENFLDDDAMFVALTVESAIQRMNSAALWIFLVVMVAAAGVAVW